MLIENCKFALRDDILGLTPYVVELHVLALRIMSFSPMLPPIGLTTGSDWEILHIAHAVCEDPVEVPLDLWHRHARYPSSRMGGHRAACSASCPSTTLMRSLSDIPNCHRHEVKKVLSS